MNNERNITRVIRTKICEVLFYDLVKKETKETVIEVVGKVDDKSVLEELFKENIGNIEDLRIIDIQIKKEVQARYFVKETDFIKAANKIENLNSEEEN